MAETNMVVSCYLIMHPRGLLPFDTGLPDDIAGRPFYERQVSRNSLLLMMFLRSAPASGLGFSCERR